MDNRSPRPGERGRSGHGHKISAMLNKRKMAVLFLLFLALVSGAVLVLVFQLFEDDYTALRYHFPILTKEGQDVTERVRRNFLWDWAPYFALPIAATLTFFITACVLLWRSHTMASLPSRSSGQAGRDIETINDSVATPEQDDAPKNLVGSVARGDVAARPR